MQFLILFSFNLILFYIRKKESKKEKKCTENSLTVLGHHTLGSDNHKTYSCGGLVNEKRKRNQQQQNKQTIMIHRE